MVQNHMLQVLCVVAMEPPWSLAPEVVRDAKVGVLNCLRPLTPADVDKYVVRGQYIEGDVHGQRVPGYRKEVRESFEIQPQSPAELVGRQLSDRERDPVFTQSMGVAQELARSLMD